MYEEKCWVVMESVGNYAKEVGRFDNIDSAAEFLENKAREDAKKEFPEDTLFEEIQEEWWEALDLAASYYTIEERG